jgi:hypothetical protein
VALALIVAHAAGDQRHVDHLVQEHVGGVAGAQTLELSTLRSKIETLEGLSISAHTHNNGCCTVQLPPCRTPFVKFRLNILVLSPHVLVLVCHEPDNSWVPGVRVDL